MRNDTKDFFSSRQQCLIYSSLAPSDKPRRMAIMPRNELVGCLLECGLTGDSLITFFELFR